MEAMMKTSELTGAALDWAVNRTNFEVNHKTIWRHFRDKCNFSTDWAISGPIIEREKISLEHLYGAGDAGEDVWVATRMEGPSFSEEQGPTALVAAMRCYVAACLGDEIEIPEELK
jgi:hypothetical protein